MAKLLDANTVIRYLTNDDPIKSKKVESFLRVNNEPLIINDVSIAEIVWVLLSHYKVPKKEIVEKLQYLFNFEALKVNKNLLNRALDIYANANIDYIDAYLIAFAEENKIPQVVSYDRDLDDFKGIKRQEP